jgi:chemotaxis protein MotC
VRPLKLVLGAVILVACIGAAGYFAVDHFDLLAAAPPLPGSAELRLEPVKEHAVAAENAHGGPAPNAAAPGEEVEQVLPADLYYPPPSTGNALIGELRKLQIAQSALAHGNKDAALVQKKALLAIADLSRKLDASKVTRPEFQALAIYLLSGGRPEVVEKNLAKFKLSKNDTKVLHGALHFSRGDNEKAVEQLQGLDVSLYPVSLGGRLAMAQYQLLEDLSPAQKRERLSFAANSLAGTLVEEAALRRWVTLAAQSGSQRDFLYVSDRYIRRYSGSLYSAEFRQALLDGIQHFENAQHPLDWVLLDGLLSKINGHALADILLDVAVNALRGGHHDLCRHATQRGLHLPAENSAGRPRFELYYQACNVAKDNLGALQALRKMVPEKLTEGDRAIYLQALQLAVDVQADGLAKQPVPSGHAAVAGELGELESIKASVAQQMKDTSLLIERSMK